MNWMKAGAIGALGSFVMFIIIFAAIQADIAPFNMPPSAAFLTKIGLGGAAKPLGLIGHFGYGIAFSIGLVALFRERTNIARGLGLAMILWLGMMLIWSPIIGWGVFGFGGAGHDLAADAPLYRGSGLKYLVATLVLHVIYGLIIGWLNPLWISWGAAHTSGAQHAPAPQHG